MTRDELRAFVHRALADIAPDADPAAVDPAESLREALDLDSMDFLALVRAIHEGLSIDVPETDYPQIDSINGCVDYLAARMA